MGLKDTLEEMKTQLEEAEKIEDGVEEAPEEIIDESTEKEVVEEKEENPEEKPEEKEEKLDNDGYRRLRREAAASKKLADDANARIAALEAKLAEPREEIVNEDRPEVMPEVAEIIQSHRMKNAEKEFQQMEDKFRRHNPDYDDISGEYARALAQSIRIQNPNLSFDTVVEKTKETLLLKAAKFVNQGFDPVEELYEEAKSLGFTAKRKETKAEEKEEDVRPDMKKVAANRARSAGTAATSGKSEGVLSKQAASEMSIAEWKRLPASEKKRLLA